MKRSKRNFFGFLFMFLFFSFNALASSNITKMKEQYKYDFINFLIPQNEIVIRTGDRIEADALLELANEDYEFYQDFYNKKIKKLEKCQLTLLIMPKIDILEKNWEALADTTDVMLVFLMEKDKLNGDYGDRSFETYLAKGLDKKIPSNTKVYKLEDDSVGNTGVRNNFEMTNVLNSRVFRRQIKEIYLEELEKIKENFKNSNFDTE
ncbi:MAG: hypothetical protein CR959_01570 [Fusobacteriales bacterium]|nr:MAG: hypothetical protein CR959_01570 [Fusobacteriales bacterium]